MKEHDLKERNLNESISVGNKMREEGKGEISDGDR